MTPLIQPAGARPLFDSRAEPVPDRLPRDGTWLNWALTLLTAPAAALVMMLVLSAALARGGCGVAGCPELGSATGLFAVVFYGPAAVAGMTMLGSFFVATRPRGVIVPLAGWALLLVDVALVSAVY